MSIIDVAALSRPVSADEPGGPDLDLEGDGDHLNFTARVEGVLPTSFASFDRASIDFKSEMEAATALLKRTRDLRVLVLLCKLCILDRRLEGFVQGLELSAAWLTEMWDDVHPKGMDGDFEFRRGVLLALDDMPHVVMPLQAAPLFETRRAGRVAYRQHLIASGAVQPRESESTLTAAQVSAALAELEPDALAAAIQAPQRIVASLGRMTAAWNAKGGGGFVLDKLRALAEGQLKFLQDEAARRNPAAVEESAGDDGAPADPALSSLKGVRTKEDADAAMLALVRYFAREEPSSLALMLLRQCRQLARLSFIDTVRLLLPDNVSSAKVRVGADPGFDLPLERLGEAPLAEDEAEQATDAAAAEDTDHWGGDDGEAAAESGSGEDGEADAGDADGGAAEESPAESAPDHRPVVAAVYNVRSRIQANELIGQVATFFRTAEPSSPIPLVLDRARGLSGRDFIGLLQEMMPADVLRLPKEE
jgi:type VI secretion system protein ImpA